MRPPTDNRKAIIPGSQKTLNAVEITINGHKAHALMDPCTIDDDLIAANFCLLNNIPTQDVDAEPLKTAIKGSRSTMTKEATVERNIQGNKIGKPCSVSNLRDCDTIFVQPFLAIPNVIMDIKNYKVSIQPTGKPRQQLFMQQKQSHAISTAAHSIYTHDDDVCYYSSSHAPETDTEDKEAEFVRYHDASAAHIQ